MEDGREAVNKGGREGGKQGGRQMRREAERDGGRWKEVMEG